MVTASLQLNIHAAVRARLAGPTNGAQGRQVVRVPSDAGVVRRTGFPRVRVAATSDHAQMHKTITECYWDRSMGTRWRWGSTEAAWVGRKG